MYRASVMLLASVLLAMAAADSDWPRDTQVLAMQCTENSIFDCKFKEGVEIPNAQVRVDNFLTEMKKTDEYKEIESLLTQTALDGGGICTNAAKLYHIAEDDCLAATYFLDYYSNTTLSALENDKENHASISMGVSSKYSKEFSVEFMDAYRNVTFILEGYVGDEMTFRVISVMGTFYMNFLTVHRLEAGKYEPLALGHATDFTYNHMESTFTNFHTFHTTHIANTHSAPACISFIKILDNIQLLTTDSIRKNIDERFLSETISNDPDVVKRNYCPYLSTAAPTPVTPDLSEIECNEANLPAYEFTLVPLGVQALSSLYYTRYRGWSDTTCQYMYPENNKGVPDRNAEPITKQVMIQNGDNFFNIEWEKNHAPNMDTFCNTAYNYTYVLYDLYTYAAPYGTLAGFSIKDQNIINAYAGMRVWPTRNINSVIVASTKYLENPGDDNDFYIGRTQKCTNVYSSTSTKEVAGCIDVMSTWNTGVFVGSLLGILIIIGMWIWGFLHNRQFEKNPPEYYKNLIAYEPRVKELKAAAKAKKAAKKAAKRAAKAKKEDEKHLVGNDDATTSEYYSTRS